MLGGEERENSVSLTQRPMQNHYNTGTMPLAPVCVVLYHTILCISRIPVFDYVGGASSCASDIVFQVVRPLRKDMVLLEDLLLKLTGIYLA